MKGKGEPEKKKGKGEPSEPEPSEAPRKRGGPREKFDYTTWKNGQDSSKKSMVKYSNETAPNAPTQRAAPAGPPSAQAQRGTGGYDSSGKGKHKGKEGSVSSQSGKGTPGKAQQMGHRTPSWGQHADTTQTTRSGWVAG